MHKFIHKKRKTEISIAQLSYKTNDIKIQKLPNFLQTLKSPNHISIATKKEKMRRGFKREKIKE